MQSMSLDINGKCAGIDKKTAASLAQESDSELFNLFAHTNKIREKLSGKKIDLCSIVNAKSGACPEDCSFCAQSARSKTEAKVYPLLDKEEIMKAAELSKKCGVRRFCIVTSGKKVSSEDLKKIGNYITEIRQTGMLPCATLGLLDADQLHELKMAGLHRYHHNLETSEAFFKEICTTHTFKDKMKTIEAARSVGLSVCSGGIFGMGESWEDRIDMAFALREIRVDSVPINFFTPISGTPLGSRGEISPLEALKIIALYRLIIPESEIRICGGRLSTLREMNPLIFLAGANGLLIGNYLTTSGKDPEEDLQMITDMGLEV